MGLIYSAKIKVKELKQYDDIKIYEPTFLYLSLDGFGKGSEVYIELDFDNGDEYHKMTLNYKQSNTSDLNDFKNFLKETSYSYDRYDNETSYTFYFTIEITEKTEYLLLFIPNFELYDNGLTITHSEFDETTKKFIIILIFVILLVIALIVYLIYICIKKLKNYYSSRTILIREKYNKKLLYEED